MLLLSKFKILGHSMEPQIKDGTSVLATSIIYLFKKPKINDIVAFKDQTGLILIKRIVRIDKNKYYLQGDNKQDSMDSRSFGLVSRINILGKVIYIF